jgi:hypothetical protein
MDVQGPIPDKGVRLYAIAHLLAGRGYEPTPSDIVRAYDYLMAAAAYCGLSEWVANQVERLIAKGAATGCEPMLRTLRARLER